MQNTNSELIRKDKYKAIWMSHSSINDYEKCPRLYYLHNIYKNKNNRKINIVSPYMSLGIAVHNVIEDLKNYKSEERVKIDLLNNFEKEWEKYHGKIGGFKNKEEEDNFKNRGIDIIKKVLIDYKMLINKTIPLSSYYTGDMLPNYYISEEENIILCGNLDWIEYVPAQKEGSRGVLSVIDFKTGKNEEKINSIQLPIYKLILENLQSKWKVNNGKYWYFESGIVTERVLDQRLLEEVKSKIIKLGIEIRDKKYTWANNARFGKAGWVEKENMEENFKCLSASDLCDCKKYEKIITGDPLAEYVGVDMYGKDAYFIQ